MTDIAEHVQVAETPLQTALDRASTGYHKDAQAYASIANAFALLALAKHFTMPLPAPHIPVGGEIR
jgi:hypothetical protein